MTVHPLFPVHAFALAAVAVLAAAAWQVSGLPPAQRAIQPVVTGSTPSPDMQRAATAAGARKADAQDDEDDEDAPEEPELEQIPIVPLSDPQALAV